MKIKGGSKYSHNHRSRRCAANLQIEYCAKVSGPSAQLCFSSCSFLSSTAAQQSKKVVIFTQDVGHLHHYVPLLASFLLLESIFLCAVSL